MVEIGEMGEMSEACPNPRTAGAGSLLRQWLRRPREKAPPLPRGFVGRGGPRSPMASEAEYARCGRRDGMGVVLGPASGLREVKM
jgi:hypothetical protein